MTEDIYDNDANEALVAAGVEGPFGPLHTRKCHPLQHPWQPLQILIAPIGPHR